VALAQATVAPSLAQRVQDIRLDDGLACEFRSVRLAFDGDEQRRRLK